MIRHSLPALLLLCCASASWAQDDALLPTHLIEGGRVFGTATFRYLQAKGDASILGVDGKLDTKATQVQFDAGVGLGMGFEIDASIAAQFDGKTHAEFPAATVEFDSTSRGFSDLAVAGIYRVLKDDAALPQLILGGIVVAPVGNDKKGQAETTVGGVKVQDDAEGGIGQGVWHYGLEAGISKNLAILEPYFLTSYVFGGKRRQNGVNEDRADVWSSTVGAQWHLSPMTTIDTRAVLNRDGVDRKENSGGRAKEELHFTYTGQVSLYVHLGGPATFVFGGGATFVQDHEVSDVAQLNVKDDYVWFVGVGLHLLLGGK